MRTAEVGRPVVDSAEQVISFGPYRLDRASGRLLRGATNLPLRHKAFAVLEFLALRPGRLVHKNELLDAVWPETHVTPSVLAGCIRELRRALGDDARESRFVETVHRRGYRFVAAGVSVDSPEVAAPIDGPHPAVVASARDAVRNVKLAELAIGFARAVASVVTAPGTERLVPARIYRTGTNRRHSSRLAERKRRRRS